MVNQSLEGNRWPVEVVLDMLGTGMTTKQILTDHPELEKEDIQDCMQFTRR